MSRSRQQMLTAAMFAVVVLVNVLSSLPSHPLGPSNANVSNKYKTAFTPAGYAFSIWGLIYSFAAAFTMWQLSPQRAEWVKQYIGYDVAANFMANAAWLPAFSTEAGKFSISLIIIFCGILLSLLRLYLRLNIGRSGMGAGRPAGSSKALTFFLGGSTPSRSAEVTVGEWACVHCFVSVYMGWTCVACIANVSIALTPAWDVATLGWTAPAWSVTMQSIAATLGGLGLVLRQDVAFAGPIAWALIAIAAQQTQEGYPGGKTASLSGSILGYSLASACCLTAALRLWKWRNGTGARFAPRDDTRGEAEEGEGGALSQKTVEDGLYADISTVGPSA